MDRNTLSAEGYAPIPGTNVMFKDHADPSAISFPRIVGGTDVQRMMGDGRVRVLAAIGSGIDLAYNYFTTAASLYLDVRAAVLGSVQLRAHNRTGGVGGSTHISVDAYIPGNFWLSVAADPGGLATRKIFVSGRQPKGIDVILCGGSLRRDFDLEIYGPKQSDYRISDGFEVRVGENFVNREFAVHLL